MCGLCLPHCPTYRLSLNEGESPRGRIALMSATARGQLPANSTALHGHLDRCLGCRACERVCPSGVPYGDLIDAGQALTRASRPLIARGLLRLTLHGILKHPQRVRSAAAALRLAQRSGLIRIARHIPVAGIQRAASQLPELAPAQEWQRFYPPVGGSRGEVALFTGCLGSVADIASNQAAITLLTRFGYGVHVPQQQRCCGALHQHAGDAEGAAELTRLNQQAFASLEVGARVKAILATASACTLTLREAAGSSAAAGNIDEVSAFLARQPWPSGLKLRPLTQPVAIHHPCTQVHGLRSHAHTTELLQRIPGIELHPLPTQARCCGAAGSYMLRQPRLSDQLGNEVLDAAQQPPETPPTLLVSANIGCIIHLQALARQREQALEILHPLSLLQRQLAPDTGLDET